MESGISRPALSRRFLVNADSLDNFDGSRKTCYRLDGRHNIGDYSIRP